VRFKQQGECDLVLLAKRVDRVSHRVDVRKDLSRVRDVRGLLAAKDEGAPGQRSGTRCLLSPDLRYLHAELQNTQVGGAWGPPFRRLSATMWGLQGTAIAIIGAARKTKSWYNSR